MRFCRLVVFFLGGLVANRQASAAICNNFVECEDGFEVLVDGTLGDFCHYACFNATGNGDRNCCVNFEDCYGFTGKVCADEGQLSCASNPIRDSSGGACRDATIPTVVSSCIGTDACKSVASDGGAVGSLSDSCVGTSACFRLAYKGGTVGPLTNSCNATRMSEFGTPMLAGACFGLGSIGGEVGPVTGSCNAERACHGMAVEGAVGPVEYSCNANSACRQAQCQGITSSCQPDSNATRISFMNGSCNTENGCENYMGDADDGLTCIANPSTPITFSPATDLCYESDGGIGVCDGYSPFCTTAPPAMPSSAPSAEPPTSSSCPAALPACALLYIIFSSVLELILM